MGLLSFLFGCGSKKGPFAKVDGVWMYEDATVVGADASSFEPLSDHYAKDKDRVYYADTYRDSKEYWSVKRYRIDTLGGADARNFVYLGHGFGKDGRRAYFAGEPFLVEDVATFVALDPSFTRDRVTGYYNRKAIDGSDGATFERLDDHYSRDAARVYFSDMITTDPARYRDSNVTVVVAGAEAATFQVAEQRYATDASHVFHDGRVLATGGMETFEVFLFGYAKTGQRVWFQGTALDADAATFEMQYDLIAEGVDARDARGWFREGKRAQRRTATDSAPSPGKG
jgi:hypothetical protein